MRPSSDRPHREGLVETLRRQVGRDYGNWTVAFTQAAAERLGLNAPDLGYLGAIAQEEPLTAGRLAELTGLTTGAITGVIDRLEKAGYVRRAPDSRDRRRVIVEPVLETALRDVAPLFEPMGRDWEEWLAGYSDEQLAFVVDFLTRAIELAQRHIARLRETAPPGKPAASPPTGR